MRVLYAGPNIDLRAVFEGAAIDDEMGERVFETTGRLPSFLFAPAKLRWFKQNEPDVYDRIDRVATLADWLRWELSGELVSEATLAAEAGLVDVRERLWCTPLLEELGIRPSSNVPVERAGTVVGGVRPEAADRTGMPEDVPVVVSPADTQCGLLGLGVGRAGQVGVVAGWSIPLLMLTSEPTFDRRTTHLDGLLRGERALEPGEHVRRRGQRIWLACRHDVVRRGASSRPYGQSDPRGPARLRGCPGLPWAASHGHEQDRPAARRVRLPRAHHLRRHWA